MIGGTPGFNASPPLNYIWEQDRRNSELADRIIRRRARAAGIPVPEVGDYGFEMPSELIDRMIKARAAQDAAAAAAAGGIGPGFGP